MPKTANLGDLLASLAQLEQDEERLQTEARVVFLRNITVEAIEPFLKYDLYQHRLRPRVAFGGYGTVVQDAAPGDGLVTRFAPDLIVLSLMLETLDGTYGTRDWNPENVREELGRLFDTVATNTSSTIAVNTFLAPCHLEPGPVLVPDQSDLLAKVASLNNFVRAHVAKRAPRFCLTDWERYQRLLGEARTMDRRFWYLTKAPFAKDFLRIYAHEIACILAALKGRAKKCLVLDCDNTLWGGIVGEDGVAGIALDNQSYPGRAFFDFQGTVVSLAERGVLVALCSKNDEKDVFEVLDRHPHCRIKRSHLAGWRVNWNPKAENLAELSEELGLGLDSFVFVDDSAAECALIRQMTPEVAVLQVPDQAHALPGLLLREGLFPSLQVSEEDRRRTRLYQSESRRKIEQSRFAKVDDYLASLDMTATVGRARADDLGRVAQLTQKTNQFNLTTRRYAEPEIRALAVDAGAAVVTVAVKDRFDDLGLVGVAILRRIPPADGGRGVVDAFLLSCRAIGRGIELALFARCTQILFDEWGVERIEASYRPTAKNAQVADLWPRLGFAETEQEGEGEGEVKTYRLGRQAPRPIIPQYLRVEGLR